MAFDIKNVDYYGSGAGNLTVANANTVINHYGQITAVDGNKLTIGNMSAGASFVVGNLLFIHTSAYTGEGSVYSHGGKWHISRITDITGDVITVKKTIRTTPLPEGVHMQIVSCPEYATVTLNAGTSITCPQFNASLGYGGIVAFKCSKELIFNGGHINLAGKGLPNESLRKLTQYESNTSMIAQENCDANIRLAMNYPDGVCWIAAKKLTGHEDSRIGNPSATGIARTPTITQGGSSILIAAESVENFQPAMIAKEPSTAGKGRARCYIATESNLPCDEGLYAYDRISDSTRMSRVFKIRSFGDGSDGNRTDYTSQLNNYARIVEMDSTRKVFTIDSKTTTGLAKFKAGALVMIHIGAKNYYALQGRFNLAKILDITLNKITVDTAFLEGTNFNRDKYYMQMVTIPQFENFTLAKENAATPKWENGIGGICAIACSDTCDLSDGTLNLVGKGGAVSGGAGMLKYISNAQMAERLPVGEGNGSVFLLAKNLKMNQTTRIGGTWTGYAYGGGRSGSGSSAGWQDYNSTGDQLYNGSGKQGGTYTLTLDSGAKIDYSGGFNSNGLYNSSSLKQISGCQGSHILIVANQITGLCIHALSTGGQGAQMKSAGLSGVTFKEACHGGCGYGGGSGVLIRNNSSLQGGSGGWLGGGAGHYHTVGDSYIDFGGGGSAGFAFVYCNKSSAQSSAGMIPILTG